nr:patatin-like phospholipase family protein [Bacteroidota bacterium]
MKQKAALVLSGGGARGMAHIGVIEELEKHGFEIVSITGTSMGALVGAVHALGKMAEFKDWLLSLDKIKIFNLIDFSFSTQGLVKGDRLIHKLKEFIPNMNIEDMSLPFAAVATDIKNKKEVVFTKGSVFEAIRASISIPTVLTPVKTENGLLVDGGVINNIPINHVKRVPDDILIAVNVNAGIEVERSKASKKEKETRQSTYQNKLLEFYNQLHLTTPTKKEEKLGYFDLITEVIGMMTNQIGKMALEKYTPDILIEVSRDACNMYDFYKAEEMVEFGKHAAIKSIEAYNKKDSVII